MCSHLQMRLIIDTWQNFDGDIRHANFGKKSKSITKYISLLSLQDEDSHLVTDLFIWCTY